MTKVSGRQELLPGLDVISQAAEVYATQTDGREADRASEEAELGCIRLLQDQAWDEHCKEVIPARQAIWDAVSAPLRESPASELVRQRSRMQSRQTEGIWRFAAMRNAENGSPIQLATTIFAKTGYGFEAPEQVQEAGDYLVAPSKGWRCPEQLLGVMATGKLLGRHLPLDELRRAKQKAHQNAVLDNLSTIQAKVEASVLGSNEKPKIICDTHVDAFWHDPVKRQDYLEHENAYMAKHEYLEASRPGAHLPQTRGNGRAIESTSAVMQFLRDQARQGWSRDPRYEQMEAVAAILTESTPL